MGSQSKKIKRGAGDHRGNVGGKKFAGNKRCPVCDEEYSYTSRTRVNCGRKKCREEYRLSYHRRRSDKQKKAQSEYGAKWYQRNKKRIKKEHKYKLENDPLYRKKCKDDHRKYHELQQKKIKNDEQYAKQHKLRRKIASRKYYNKNRDKYLEYGKKYHKENPEIRRAQVLRRRALIKTATLPDTDPLAIRKIELRRQKMQKETGVKYETDHIIPLDIGGAHHQDNIRIITDKENKEKGTEYYPELGGVWANNVLAKKTKKTLGIQ